MSERRIIRQALTILRLRHYLRLSALDSEAWDDDSCPLSLNPDLIRRLTGDRMVESAAQALSGFACLRATGGTRWRRAFSAWDEEGLSRSVCKTDAAIGERHRAPEAAFQICCEAEVELIGMELATWRANRFHATRPAHHPKGHLL